jgi:hypothetical protein
MVRAPATHTHRQECTNAPQERRSPTPIPTTTSCESEKGEGSIGQGPGMLLWGGPSIPQTQTTHLSRQALHPHHLFSSSVEMVCL